MTSDLPLPPGQALTRKFPVVGEKDASAVPPLDAWRLEVDGLIDPSFRLTWELLEDQKQFLSAGSPPRPW